MDLGVHLIRFLVGKPVAVLLKFKLNITEVLLVLKMAKRF